MAEDTNNGFLNHFLNDLENRTKMRIGPEFLVSEIKDLFYQAYYAYLKAVSSPVAEQILNGLGISSRSGYQLQHKGNDFHLVISTSGKKYRLDHVETCFIDSKGQFNSKGYYDDEAIERFNYRLFALFDQILDEQGKIH